jgi:hypothetical protein
MVDESSRRRSLAQVEAALCFCGVTDVQTFDALLDDAESIAQLRGWLQSVHWPDDAGVADRGTQTTAVSMVDVSAAAAPTTRSVQNQATFSLGPTPVRLVSVETQAAVRVPQRAQASQVNVAVPVADAAVGAAACMADAHTQSVVETANASTSHYLVPGLGLKAAATQTVLDVAAIEDTLQSTLLAFDSNQAAKLALEERVTELEGQLSKRVHSADASAQTELDVEGLYRLEEGLLQEALGTRKANTRLNITYSKSFLDGTDSD